MASSSGGTSTSDESSTTTADIPRLITSCGPAGSKVSVREAGENIISTVTTVNESMSILPPIGSFVPTGSKRSSKEGESSLSKTTTSRTTKDIPRLITSFGPAGSKLTVREAGENILNSFCHSYPDTDVHSIIPNLFNGNITELMDPKPNITRKEEEKRRGREINQEGEKHENAVFNLFLRLIRQSDIPTTLLIMRTFEMDTKNDVGLKRQALMTEMPGLDLKEAITRAENDFVVLVKDCGIVFVEVKGSTKDNNVKSAEKQLHNVNSIVQSVMKAMTADKERTLPTMKLIIILDCTDPSPVETSQGSYFLFKDSCDNFEQQWIGVVNKLIELKSSNPFSSDEFKELSQLLVGIWSANTACVINRGARTYHLQQNEAEFSYVKQLEETDRVVDTGDIRNETHFKLQKDKLEPFTDIVRTAEQDIFRTCNDIKLCYLTPAQKEVFDHHKQALIRGVAGSGKSLLLFFKVIELVNISESRIFILAPRPHNIRIYNVLRSKNITVEMIEEFPPLSSESNVFVMDIDSFFHVKRRTLMDYNLRNFHLFVDDSQYLLFDEEVDGLSFYDVGDFIERTYETCVQYNTYFWFMLDVLQGGYNDDGTDSYSVDLFKTRDNEQRTYNIPIIQLQHVMRNTHEVAQLTNQLREWFEDYYKSASPPTPQVGHRVTSRIPLHHKLQFGTDDKYKLPFIIARLREELKYVTTPPYSLPLSSVAIILDAVDPSQHKKTIASFLKTEFGTTPQSVEEQLTSENRTDIIMDKFDNMMSFESPVVVSICNNVFDAMYYTICARARVLLVVIDVSGYSDFDESSNIDTVKWKPDYNDLFDHSNDTFIRY